MLIGSASSLLFNGNPLLRFDGYYVLSDAIEIPNLAARSNQYLGYLVLKRVFGLKGVRQPVTARGEEPWFVCYGIAAFVYRLLVMFAIALFIAGRFFAVGVVLALSTLAMQVVAPVLRQASFVLTNPRLAGSSCRFPSRRAPRASSGRPRARRCEPVRRASWKRSSLRPARRWLRVRP
jgi:putative peptide zinc metalloprotease protein